MMHPLQVFKQVRADVLALLLLSFFIFLLIKPMRANEGMWRIFDDVHIARSEALLTELHAGQFPVRMLQSFGNGGGYPLFNYYSPLTYYVSAGLIQLGIHPLNSVKLVFQGAYVLLTIGMYAYLRVGLQLSRKSALVGAIAAISSAYFNYDAYTRGALAELLGFAMLPWVLGFFELLLKNKKWYSLLGAAATLSIVFLFHAITGIIAVLLLTVIVGVRAVVNKKNALQYILATTKLFAVTGLLSAWYLLPVLLEKGYVRYSVVDFVKTGYKDAAISMQELLGFTSINPEIKPITLGLGISLLLVLCMGLLIKKYLKNNGKSDSFFVEHERVLSYGVSVLVTLFLLSPASWFLWEHSSILQTMQFPYRFLSFLTCISIAFILTTSTQTLSKIYRGLLLLALLGASYQTQYFAQPSGYYFSDRFAAEDLCTTTTWQQEYLPIDTKECIIKDSMPLAVGSEGLETTVSSSEQGKIEVKTNGLAGTIMFTKYYFPGWKVFTDSTELHAFPTSEHGLLTVEVPEGIHTIKAEYGKTTVQLVSEWISLVTIAVLTLYATRKTLMSFKQA